MAVEDDSGDENTNSRMTTTLQRRIIVSGGGEDGRGREAESVKKSINDILINQCDSYKRSFPVSNVAKTIKPSL